MDKLPEPEFIPNNNWPRLMTGVEDYINLKEKNRKLFFLGFSGASIFRYWREVTFYKKDNLKFLGIIIPSFVITSIALARYLTYDPYAYAALRNNENELKYQEEYKQLWREYKKKNIEIPDDLIR